MAILMKDGKILTIDGKTIKAPIGGGSNVPLFAPSLTAKNKTITISDTQNGAFVESHSCYLNNKYISNIEGSLDISSHLSLDKETQTFTATSSGLLSDSGKSNGINYHKVVFKNQDETVLRTQVELESEEFEYDGKHPVYDGNFYGWNENKNGVTRLNPLVVEEPTTLYAIYTQDFADAVAQIGVYGELYNSTGVLECVTINNIIYILVNGSVYMFDPFSEDKTLTKIGNFESRSASVYNNKICTLNNKCDTLNLFDVNNGNVESITLTLEKGEYESCKNDYPIAVIGDKLYFWTHNTTDRYIRLYCYDLISNTYEIVYSQGNKSFLEAYDMIAVDGTIYYAFEGAEIHSISNGEHKSIVQGGTKVMGYNYGPLTYLNGKFYMPKKTGEIGEYNPEGKTTSGSILYNGVITKMEGVLKLALTGTADAYRCVQGVTIGSSIYFIGDGRIQKYY